VNRAKLDNFPGRNRYWLLWPQEFAMQSKYSLDTADTRRRDGIILFRIVRTDGTRGGYVQAEANLSQQGTCWLHGDSEAYADARITENAQVFGQVFGRASVTGDCKVTGQVFDSAVVTDRAQVMGRAYGRAVVRGSARVMGEALDDAVVEGSAMILGRISGHATASGTDIVLGDRSAPAGPRPGPDAPGSAAANAAPATPVVEVTGYFASSLVDGSVRLYLEPSFASFVDVHQPEQNIVDWTEINKAAGLARVSIKASAKVDIGKTARSVHISTL
jgi:hypothetical protein